VRITRQLFSLVILTAVASAVVGQTAAKIPESKLFDAAKLIEDVRVLSADEMQGRATEQPAITKVRDYLRNRFTEVDLSPIGPGFEQKLRMSQLGNPHYFDVVNFVGLLKGQKNPDRYLVVTAHYDHLGVRDGVVFNGADDNASGTAALFAIASYFKKHKPEHSLIFVAFDAEERGLTGSRHFVRNLPVPKESIVLNVNMDMIGRNDKNELYAAGTFSYPQLKRFLENVQAKAGVKLLLGHDDPKLGRDDWTGQSDQGAFHAAKIPFIYFGVEDHPDYHKPSDDFANIQPDFYVKAVETVIAALKELDKATLK